jgi:uncharacterized protein YeeX (DUF496 family)
MGEELNNLFQPYNIGGVTMPYDACDGISIDIHDTKQEIADLEQAVRNNQVSLNLHDQYISELRQQVQDAMLNIIYPGRIASLLLDKIEKFIATNAKVITTDTGLTTKMIEVSQLEGAIKKLREIVQNKEVSSK